MKKVQYFMEDLLTHEDESKLAEFISDNGITVMGENNWKIVHTAIEYDYKHAGTVDLLAGHTCPAASLCHSRVNKDSNGKRTIEDLGIFRCYATKSEVQYEAVYELHRRNGEEITVLESFPLIMTYIIRTKKIDLMRIHSSGDFYDFEYFKKWIQIAKWNPQVTFFGYTKQATFVRYLLHNQVDNLSIVYSYGGIHDGYAIKHNLPSCTVVTHDFAYHAHGTIVEKTSTGWQYSNPIGKKRGKVIYKHVECCFYLEYGQYWNPYKQAIESLSCMHDSTRQQVDDFERILRMESFGILFH